MPLTRARPAVKPLAVRLVADAAPLTVKLPVTVVFRSSCICALLQWSRSTPPKFDVPESAPVTKDSAKLPRVNIFIAPEPYCPTPYLFTGSLPNDD